MIKRLFITSAVLVVVVFFVGPYVNKQYYGSRIHQFIEEHASASLSDIQIGSVRLPDISLAKCIDFVSSIGSLPGRVADAVDNYRLQKEYEQNSYVSPYSVTSDSLRANGGINIDKDALIDGAKATGKGLWNAYISFWVRQEEKMGDLKPAFDQLDEQNSAVSSGNDGGDKINVEEIDVSNLYID